MKRTLILIAAVCAVQVAGGTAVAQYPDCNQSFVIPPARLGLSPKNLEVATQFQYTLRMQLWNMAGAPEANWPAGDIVLEVAAPCPNPFTGLNPNGPSNANGIITWGPIELDRPGGSCAGANVVHIRIISVNCDYFLNSVTSPDEDGDGLVALADLSVFQQAFVNGGPTHQGDLNLSDGRPDLGDLGFFQRHFVAP